MSLQGLTDHGSGSRTPANSSGVRTTKSVKIPKSVALLGILLLYKYMKKALKIIGYIVLGFIGFTILLSIVSDPIPEEGSNPQEEISVDVQEGEDSQEEIVPIEEEILETQEVVIPTQNTSNSNTKIEEKTSASDTSQSQKTYLVTKVVDGDTLTISKDGSSVTLRLIGIDTPETVHPSKPVECFGTEASNKAKSLLSGKYITLEMDDSQGTYDKYQRMLAYVYLPDGTMFNKYMISEGYAYEYTYGTPYKYQSEFKQTQSSAKQNKKGLWADGVCEEETPAPVQTTTTNQSSSNINTSNYSCSLNIYNCSNFKTQSEAHSVFEMCGGSSNDIHRLDSDGDGEVCESLP